jgi:hypothetical protein
MPHLIAAVYVQDPATRECLILLPGESPDPGIAALITNPDAWDVPPDPACRTESAVSRPRMANPAPDGGQAGNDQADERPTAKKTTQRRARPAAQ